MNTILKTVLIGTTLGLIASTSAWAQGMGQGLVGTNCKTEIAKYCANVGHGNGEVPACLVKHKDKLSPACKMALARKGPGGGMGQGKARGARAR